MQNVTAQAQLINSWENSVEGRGPGAPWTSGGFSTTTGVTDGLYSWILTASSAPTYAFAFGSTASTARTTELATATSVKIDVYAPAASFGYYLQWDLTLNNSVFGYQSADGYSFPQAATIGGEATLTFTISPSLQAQLVANPTSTTSINFQLGGGAPGTIYVDNLRIIQPVPEPATLALMDLGCAGLLIFRRRLS